ncbi:WhiB family transcriptional regulator [Mycobacterium sp. DBP42]|uniref:WhiB family transcriptional regulator n=1 Tax=Mycobacteriaceae TaxID=1762 RepID=UPI0020183416|nr:WhiB family transcriptional regulator [Mycobacterium sp. DBP42]
MNATTIEGTSITVAGQQQRAAQMNRYVAHEMNDRGTPPPLIAAHLKVDVRSVTRYLQSPRPAKPEELVTLDSFFLRGACKGRAALMFSDEPEDQEQAKQICADCPVLMQCRSYGLTTGRQEGGIWGGLTEKERRPRRRRKRASA